MPNSAKKIICLQLNEVDLDDIREIPVSVSRNYTVTILLERFLVFFFTKLNSNKTYMKYQYTKFKAPFSYCSKIELCR